MAIRPASAAQRERIRRSDASSRAQAERVCARALAEPDRNAALRFLNEALPSLETELPGIRNEGLFSDHELARGARLRPDWAAAQSRAAPLLGVGGLELLHRLGFEVRKLDGVTHLLRAGTRDRAVAVLLNAGESPESAAPRFQNLSPVSWALAMADQRNLPWVVVVQGDRLRLYPVALGIGVGRRGRTETWIEMRTGLLRQDQAALLWLVFSADALQPEGSLEQLLDSSKRFASDLAVRLRERIYDRVVPRLATGIAEARALAAFTAEELRLTYAMALTVLFRLLFIAYAEDRDLLPFTTNEAYRRRALKTKAQELAAKTAPPGAGAHLWQEVTRLFDAVRRGDAALGVPAYGGGLFETDPAISPVGAELARISLPDAVFEPVLRALLLDEGKDLAAPAGPVDFRSLRVREFGTIYEGLLESELAVADTDLALKRQDNALVYVPAKAKDQVAVPKGAIYLHNRSGARKSSGSYFTPSFAVDHLLETALRPALAAHAERLAALDDEEAAEAFFDIRIADIAMGSGHFLVAAIDVVEQGLSAVLAKRPLPGVKAELAKLRAAAEAELRKLGLGGTMQIEDSQLLRRLIARRCIYGVDLNPLAVELARLSIWIHTFVPGLPLSLLDHALVAGNALVGIATVDQLQERFAASGTALFPVDAESLLGQAAEPLRRLARLADATPEEVAAARQAMAGARQAVEETRALCDLVLAERIAPKEVAFQFETWPQERARIGAHPALKRAREVLAGLAVLHFPVAFPEVFLRPRPGFDVILGNPPWQEVTVEELGFWTRHFPGLKGVTEAERKRRLPELRGERPDLVAEYEREVAQAKREREVLGAGFFPGLGAGDPDLYKAFAWRFWQLAAAEGGRIGVVLPRSALSALGSQALREALFSGSAAVEVTTLLNRSGWVFPEVHQQFTITLLCLFRGRPEGASIALRGPFADPAAWQAAKTRPPHRFTPEEVLGWTSSASLPLLPSDESIAVFTRLRRAPRLDRRAPGEWRARPDTELHATSDKALMTFDPPSTEGLWPVFKGESFDLWQNDLGPASYYAWAEPGPVLARLQQKRLNSGRSRRDSAHAEFPPAHLRDPATLPCHAPRIVFRDVSRATDTRTVRAALAPPRVFLHQQGSLPALAQRAMQKTKPSCSACSVPSRSTGTRGAIVEVEPQLLHPQPVPHSAPAAQRPPLAARGGSRRPPRLPGCALRRLGGGRRSRLRPARSGRETGDDRGTGRRRGTPLRPQPRPARPHLRHLPRLADRSRLGGLERPARPHGRHPAGACMTPRPELITNQGGNTLLAALAAAIPDAPRPPGLGETPAGVREIAIATAFLSPAGFAAVAERLEQAERVRLLLGAEPEPEALRLARRHLRKPGDPPAAAFERRELAEALKLLEAGLRAERDRMPFSAETRRHLRRMAAMLRSGTLETRRYEKAFLHAKAILIDGPEPGLIAGSSNLTRAGLTTNLELNLARWDAAIFAQAKAWFDGLWDEAAPFDLAAILEEPEQEFPPWLIFLRILWQLYGGELEEERKEEGEIPLTAFQLHGVWRARRILREFGGVIVADEVGLGKTFIGGAILEAYARNRQRALLLCPAALRESWDRFLDEHNIGRFVELLSFDQVARDRQLFDPDRRPRARGNHLRAALDEYQLIVVDEAHNYRNPDSSHRADVLRRLLYGQRKDLVLLTATPVNNSLWDFYHLQRYFVRQDSALAQPRHRQHPRPVQGGSKTGSGQPQPRFPLSDHRCPDRQAHARLCQEALRWRNDPRPRWGDAPDRLSEGGGDHRALRPRTAWPPACSTRWPMLWIRSTAATC
ncbi:MAG: phospholipase D-like domain-containing protein [Acetobacteraceae bacterium]|nr:phospholipase D-like domain-containing protein [Acetobacteraceae bacterium]